MAAKRARVSSDLEFLGSDVKTLEGPSLPTKGEVLSAYLHQLAESPEKPAEEIVKQVVRSVFAIWRKNKIPTTGTGNGRKYLRKLLAAFQQMKDAYSSADKEHRRAIISAFRQKCDLVFSIGADVAVDCCTPTKAQLIEEGRKDKIKFDEKSIEKQVKLLGDAGEEWSDENKNTLNVSEVMQPPRKRFKREDHRAGDDPEESIGEAAGGEVGNNDEKPSTSAASSSSLQHEIMTEAEAARFYEELLRGHEEMERKLQEMDAERAAIESDTVGMRVDDAANEKTKSKGPSRKTRTTDEPAYVEMTVNQRDSLDEAASASRTRSPKLLPKTKLFEEELEHANESPLSMHQEMQVVSSWIAKIERVLEYAKSARHRIELPVKGPLENLTVASSVSSPEPAERHSRESQSHKSKAQSREEDKAASSSSSSSSENVEMQAQNPTKQTEHRARAMNKPANFELSVNQRGTLDEAASINRTITPKLLLGLAKTKRYEEELAQASEVLDSLSRETRADASWIAEVSNLLENAKSLEERIQVPAEVQLEVLAVASSASPLKLAEKQSQESENKKVEEQLQILTGASSTSSSKPAEMHSREPDNTEVLPVERTLVVAGKRSRESATEEDSLGSASTPKKRARIEGGSPPVTEVQNLSRRSSSDNVSSSSSDCRWHGSSSNNISSSSSSSSSSAYPATSSSDNITNSSSDYSTDSLEVAARSVSREANNSSLYMADNEKELTSSIDEESFVSGTIAIAPQLRQAAESPSAPQQGHLLGNAGSSGDLGQVVVASGSHEVMNLNRHVELTSAHTSRNDAITLDLFATENQVETREVPVVQRVGFSDESEILAFAFENAGPLPIANQVIAEVVRPNEIPDAESPDSPPTYFVL